MKKSLVASGGAAFIIAVASVGVVQAQKESSKDNKKVIYVAAEHATFKQSPTAGVSMAVLWGDADKGAHATFTKFAPGYDAGMHTHTNDVWIVVLKGAYLYKDDVIDKRLVVGSRSFLRVPAGMKHWSGDDPKEGALFYEESSGKFDSIPAK